MAVTPAAPSCAAVGKWRSRCQGMGLSKSLSKQAAKPGRAASVEVLKDSEVVATFQPGKAEYRGRWTDPQPSRGVHYYYVRVQQEDSELAWSSPMWIDFAP